MSHIVTEYEKTLEAEKEALKRELERTRDENRQLKELSYSLMKKRKPGDFQMLALHSPLL